MSPEPRIEHRNELSYVGIETSTTMDGLAGAIDRHFGVLFGWLQAHGVEPSAAPLIRYLRIDMDGEFELEFGVPVPPDVQVPSDVQEDDHVRSRVLPAGRYVTLLHVGPYDGLVGANATLQEWAKERGMRWQMTDDGSRWAARVEQYLTDPSRESDPSRLETELAYLTADD